MSGMYSLVFGSRGDQLYGVAKFLLGEETHTGRYRDMWFEENPADPSGESCILAIYTRNGGGNREEYDPQIKSMQVHPAYVEDADDSFDSTYATFRFVFKFSELDEKDPGMGDAVRDQLVERVDMSEVWQEAIARIGKPDGE